MKKWKTLKVVGWILSIVFWIDLGYILYGCASVRHTPSDIIWHLGWAIAMIIVGTVLINVANKKIKAKKDL